MSLIIKCDRCGTIAPKPGKMPTGWSSYAEYRSSRFRLLSTYVAMRHICPSCPKDKPEAEIPEGLPILTVDQALAELEESARMAALDPTELKGSSRTLIVRALAILDEARSRLELRVIQGENKEEEE